MLSRDSEDVERREVSRVAPRFHIELRTDASNKFRAAAFCGKHPGKKKQIARLRRFHIGAERFRRRRELDAKFFQPLFRRWPAESLRGLPFANVRTAIHVLPLFCGHSCQTATVAAA